MVRLGKMYQGLAKSSTMFTTAYLSMHENYFVLFSQHGLNRPVYFNSIDQAQTGYSIMQLWITSHFYIRLVEYTHTYYVSTNVKFKCI